jgi:hypothetical protein
VGKGHRLLSCVATSGRYGDRCHIFVLEIHVLAEFRHHLPGHEVTYLLIFVAPSCATKFPVHSSISVDNAHTSAQHTSPPLDAHITCHPLAVLAPPTVRRVCAALLDSAIPVHPQRAPPSVRHGPGGRSSAHRPRHTAGLWCAAGPGAEERSRRDSGYSAR